MFTKRPHLSGTVQCRRRWWTQPGLGIVWHFIVRCVGVESGRTGKSRNTLLNTHVPFALDRAKCRLTCQTDKKRCLSRLHEHEYELIVTSELQVSRRSSNRERERERKRTSKSTMRLSTHLHCSATLGWR
jgi:Golgi nucleoside diphosphatase